MENFKKVLAFILSMTCAVWLMFVGIAGLLVASAYWTCNGYTVAPTKVMAGSCYVEQPNGKWVTHSSYVEATSVELNTDKPSTK